MILARIILISVYARLVRQISISEGPGCCLFVITLTRSQDTGFDLLHSYAVPGPKSKRLSAFPLIICEARIAQPALWDERVGKDEVLRTVIHCPLGYSGNSLCKWLVTILQFLGTLPRFGSVEETYTFR